MYFKINLSDKIKQTCPEFRAGIICATVTNSQENLLLWEEITNECELLKQSFSLEQINQRPPILATRNAYKRTGKDPNRYRPSAEALTRRVVRNLGLYHINTLVDLINLSPYVAVIPSEDSMLKKLQGKSSLWESARPESYFMG